MGLKQDLAEGRAVTHLVWAPRYQYEAEEAAARGEDWAAERLRESAGAEREKAEEIFAKYPGLDRSKVEAQAAEQHAQWREGHEVEAQRKAETPGERKPREAEEKARRKAEEKARRKAEREERKQRKAEERAKRIAEYEARQEEKILDAQTRPVRQGRRRAEVGSYRLSRKQVRNLPAWVKTAIDAESRAKATWEDAPPFTKPQRIYRERCKEEYLARSREAAEAHQYLASLEKKGLGVGGAVASIGIATFLF